eukprot:359993-Chlamydomonas_euryale.AAC.10
MQLCRQKVPPVGRRPRQSDAVRQPCSVHTSVTSLVSPDEWKDREPEVVKSVEQLVAFQSSLSGT